MIAAVNTVAPVVPSEVQFHPGVAKAWINFTPGNPPIINEAYNCTIARTPAGLGAGDYTVTFTVPFANTTYSLSGTSLYDYLPSNDGAIICIGAYVNAQQTGSCRIAVRTLGSGVLFDGGLATITFHGTQ
jgi:hypothetical protein